MVDTEIRLFIFFAAKDGEALYSQQNKTGADCGSDHELLIAKLRLKLKKVEKTTTLFRYDSNQIPYDYAVEVKNRFKGLDLTDRVPDELWLVVCDIEQETGIKTIPRKKKCKKKKSSPSSHYSQNTILPTLATPIPEVCIVFPCIAI